MIESRYWKEDLLKLIKDIKPKRKPRKWSDKYQNYIEKRISISFFIIRKLIENNKVTVALQKEDITFGCFEAKKNVTRVNQHNVAEIYNLDKLKTCSMKLKNICDIIVHTEIIYALRGVDRNWSHLLFASDKGKKEKIYCLKIETLIKILNAVGSDYADNILYQWDEKKGDYVVKSFNNAFGEDEVQELLKIIGR